MFYISKQISKFRYMIMDTEDNTEESCSLQDIKSYIHLGLSINGVTILNGQLYISVFTELTDKLKAKNTIIVNSPLGSNFKSKLAGNNVVLTGISYDYLVSLFSKSSSPVLVLPEGLTLITSEFWDSVNSNLELAKKNRNIDTMCSKFKSVILPSTLTVIKMYSFSGCNTSNLIIPITVKYIEALSFYNAYVTNLYIEGNTVLDSSCIHGICSLKYALVRSEIIPAYCFHDTSIVNVDLPNAVSIGFNAFETCSQLKSITLSSQIREINELRCYSNEYSIKNFYKLPVYTLSLLFPIDVDLNSIKINSSNTDINLVLPIRYVSIASELFKNYRSCLIYYRDEELQHVWNNCRNSKTKTDIYSRHNKIRLYQT